MREVGKCRFKEMTTIHSGGVVNSKKLLWYMNVTLTRPHLRKVCHPHCEFTYEQTFSPKKEFFVRMKRKRSNMKLNTL